MPSRGPAGQGALPGPSLQDLLSEKAVTPPPSGPASAAKIPRVWGDPSRNTNAFSLVPI